MTQYSYNENRNEGRRRSKKREEHGFLYYFYPSAQTFAQTFAHKKKIVRVVQIIVLCKGAQTQMVRSRQAGTKNTGKTDFTHGKRGVQ